MKNEERNMGIDALRIFSMFLIVLLHSLKQGGILTHVESASAQDYLAWLLVVIAYCSVDCYALISGYVGAKSTWRFSRLVSLWLQVFFYSSLITAYFAVRMPQNVNLYIWFKSLLPIMSRQYWYVTCYFGLLVFIPFLNAGIRSLQGRPLRRLLMIGLALFSLLPCLLQGYPFNFSPDIDAFGMFNGYSLIWLLFLYLLGACLRECRITSVKTGIWVALLFFSVVLTWGSLFVLPKITLARFGEVRYTVILLNYTSPTILAAAVCFLALWAGHPPKSRVGCGLVSLLAPSSLSVYLIHTHPLLWEAYIRDYASPLAGAAPLAMVAGVLGCSALIYLLCTVIDFIRRLLFKLLRVDFLCRQMDRL